MSDSDDSLVVSCKNLTKCFETQAETLNVLRGIDLGLPLKSSCSIMGSSGSGKSTLLSIIGGLERFDSGEVRVGQYRLHSLAEKDLPSFRSSVVGFVFQFHYLLKDFTALENVALPAFMAGIPRKESWQKAEALLEKVGMLDRKDHYPAELSGGERQRTAIARALVNSPAVVLADEPTGNLDAANAAAIRDLLFGLPEFSDTSIILATHDGILAAGATHRFLLSEGRLQAL